MKTRYILLPFVLLSCLAASPAFVEGAVPSYSWVRYRDGDPRYWILKDHDRGIGVWIVSSRVYRPYLSSVAPVGDGFGVPTDPPTEPPASVTALPTGVVSERIDPGHRMINGVEITQEEEQAALTASVPDDSNKNRLTVIGTVEECKKVVGDFLTSPDLEGLRSRTLIQEYRPTEWPVAPVRLADGGHPDIVLEDPRGVVLGRLHDYQGVDDLRKIDPSYDPLKDPNPRVPPPIPQSPSSVPVWVWYAASVCGLLYLLKKGK